MKIENKSSIEKNNGLTVVENKGVVNYGLTYKETTDLCNLLIKNALAELKNEAFIEAKKRDEEFVNKVVELLNNKNVDAAKARQTFSTPSMQYDYVEAEKSYIKYGTDNLLSMLSEILSERINIPEYSLLQVSLSESIKTCALLSEKHFAILGLNFLLKYSKRIDILDLPSFVSFIQNCVLKLYNQCKDSTRSDLQHLNYRRCAVPSLMSFDIIEILKESYGGLLLKGVTKEGMKKIEGLPIIEKYPNLFMNCLHDSSKFQLAFIDKKVLEDKLKSLNVNEKELKIILSEFDNEYMSKDEINEYLQSNCDSWKDFVKFWSTTKISSIDLSSVGIVLGALFIRKMTNQNYDLNIWIK